MNKSNIFVVFGAADVEASLANGLLDQIGIRHTYATIDGDRVRARDAYRATGTAEEPPDRASVVWFECGIMMSSTTPTARLDHHSPGDPGYGRPPAEFLAASSIGQLISLLGKLSLLLDSDWEMIERDTHTVGGEIEHVNGRWVVCVQSSASDVNIPNLQPCVRPSVWAVVPDEYVLAAAADHCLHAAYRGGCPGVDPDVLALWRVTQRAKHQHRSAGEIMRDVDTAREALRLADYLRLANECPICGGSVSAADEDTSSASGCYCYPRPMEVADMRGDSRPPELPEAAAREQRCFVADGLAVNGRIKIICQGGSPEQIAAFKQWAERQGYTDPYGDPARGFAGAYSN